MPAPEYCFLWIDWWPLCMSKSEWSGWAQAVGAMLAIGVAILIPVVNEGRGRRRDIHWAQAALVDLENAISECFDACNQMNEANLTSARLQVQRAIDGCGRLQFSSLTHQEWAGIVSCLNLAIDVHHRSHNLRARSNWTHWAHEFDAVAGGIGAVKRVVFVKAS